MSPTHDEIKPSALESIEHELYDPKAIIGGGEIHETRTRRDLSLPTSWGEEGPVLTGGREGKQGFSFGAKLLLIATIFLFIAVAFSAWRVISLRNVVSAANIDMTVDSIPYVEGGESVPLTLTLRNRNTSALESAYVTLLYKQGSGSQDEQEKIQEKRELGSILRDEYKKQDFSLVLYGSEGEKRDIALKLEYKVAGSNALFTKIVTTQAVLRTPPISITIDGPDKLSVGQSGTFTFMVKNNSATTSISSVLQIIFPNTFSVESTSPKSIARSNSWNITKLAKGETEVISVTGSFKGKSGEVSTLAAKIGSQGDSSSAIGVVYSAASHDTTLRSSPLTIGMTLASQEAAGGESLRYNDKALITITYNNSSTQALEDVSVKLQLSGDAAVYSQINPTNGYYDSVKKTITWDKTIFPEFAVLPPNARGTLQVVIPTVPRGTNSPTLTTSIVGTASTKTQDDVIATYSKTYAIQGSASLEAHTQYKTSSFANTGPVPPVPNKETTYTLALTVAAQNALSAAKVSFVLPTYVSWRNVIAPSGSPISYDVKTKTVTWNIGPLQEGKSAQAEIGVVVKPSQSHVNQAPAITSGIVLDATEEVSQARLRTTMTPLSTAVHNESWPSNPSLVRDN